ncbi:MAG TPA: TonB-dependent siderophore receptor [Solimonas sp.]|nr:TonB-dependent siderophore receptor [Solimonas sp.]
MNFRLNPIAVAMLTALSAPALAEELEVASSTTALPEIVVEGHAEPAAYAVPEVRSATRTDTPVRDVPQSITVISRDLVRDQAMQNIADAVRYVPGVGMAQGEGNRETPILRGNASTSDFFVDGLRDDVQYYRDLYNLERLEVLKGPNAMIFGRGGVGGVINRVTRQADWSSVRELGLEGGSFEHRRITADVAEGFNDKIAGRVTAVYEDSNSYRDHVTLERLGINPTLALRTGENTVVRLGYEYFNDERIADRGIPSDGAGKPFKVNASTFFGDPGRSPVDAEINAVTALVEHDFGGGLSLRNSTRYGDYAKFYQNVFASGPVSATGTVPMQAYFSANDRQNLFNQTDLVWKLQGGGIAHTLLAGVELGRQVSDNFRLSGRFADGADADSDPDATFVASASDPTIDEPLVAFVQGASDGNNESVARIAAFYVQDQMQILPQLQAVLGLRYDRFEIDFINRRTGVAPADRELGSGDDLLSPRAGLVYKPVEPVSIYASYTLSYLPRVGEQLGSLSPSNQALDPEEYRNYEVGAKWDIDSDLALTLALYQLDRDNVLLVNPVAGGPSILGEGARTRGVELGWTGKLTSAWSIAGGYAWQDGELTGTSNAASARDGATLAQLPKHTASLWNRYDFSPQWGAGLGAYYRSDMYTSTANTVTLDGYTRLDAAVFYRLNEHFRAQINVENLLDEDYVVNAHNDNNIQPGSPTAVRASVTLRF